MATNFTRKTYVDYSTPVVDAQWLNGMQEKVDLVVNDSDYAVVGDGVTNDSAALLAAATQAVAVGGALVLRGNKTYNVGTAPLVFPAGLKLYTLGATFTTDTTTTGDGYLITIADNTSIDELIVSVPSGKQRDRCVLLDGNNINVGLIKLTSVSQQANTAGADGAVQILTGTGNRVGLIQVTNWDRAVVIGGTTGTTVGRIEVTSYVRGVYGYDNTGLTINSGLVKTASPNALGNPGHNGVLLSATTTNAQENLTFRDFAVEDSGEHGWRIGGPEQQRNMRFSNCRSFNTGGNGFKVLGTDSGIPTATNQNIIIENFVAEDAGMDATLSGQNRSGLLIKFCQHVQIVSPIVRTRSATYSAQYGILLDGVDFVTITSPELSGAQFDGIYLQAIDGDVDYVTINGGLCYNNTQHGLRVYVDSGKTVRSLQVSEITCHSNIQKGISVENSGTMNFSVISAKTVGNDAGMAACNEVACNLQIVTNGAEVALTPLSGITAANSSWVADGTSFSIRKAGSWVAL